MEQLMVAYQQANDAKKTIDAANRLLQVNPNNIRALALLAYNYRAAASQGGPQMQQNLQHGAAVWPEGIAGAEQYAQAGWHERC